MELLRVSYSSLGTFSSCPRKFELDKLYPKRARDDDNYAADVGKALHTGYQNFLIHGDREAAIWAMMEVFPFESEFMQSNDYRSFDAALATLELMFDEIRMGEYELAKIRKPMTPAERLGELFVATHENREPVFSTAVPAIEVPFEIRFKGLTIPPCARYPEGAQLSIVGYIDAILRSVVTECFRTMDIKTSRMKLKDSTPKYKFDTQQVPYGIVVDHVAGVPVESFEVLYLDCYVDVVDPCVELYPFMKGQLDIQEWATTKVIQFQQIAKYAQMDFFPRTDNGCLFYNSPCRYLEPCMSRDREALMMWFTMGEEPAPPENFVPWIVADIDVGI